MPSSSDKQKKLMNIASHTKGGYGGVPEKVGKEFHSADKAKEFAKKKKSPKLNLKKGYSDHGKAF